jgi:hypothetical protein
MNPQGVRPLEEYSSFNDYSRSQKISRDAVLTRVLAGDCLIEGRFTERKRLFPVKNALT